MGSDDLWRRWGEWGKYNAGGMKGGEALIQEINRIVHESGFSSPVSTKRGFNARLNYLCKSAAGYEEMRRQGISARLVKSWRSGKSKPSAASREKLENAYWTRRRENLIRSGELKRKLNNDGHGRRIEIYPVDQSHVDEKRKRSNVNERSVQGRYIWDDLVDAWADQNSDLIDDIWEDIISDIDSDWAAYAYVSAVSIGV